MELLDCYLNFLSDHKCIVMRKSHYAGDSVIKEFKESQPKEKKTPQFSIVVEDNEEDNSDQSQEPLDLSSLNGTNWINDSIVDCFGKLLMKQHHDIFFFPVFFNYSFLVLKRSYDRFSRCDRSSNLFGCRLVLIPLLLHSHWHLCAYYPEKRKLCILDPYVEETTEECLMAQHLVTLKKIEDDFLKVHFQKRTGDDWIEVRKVVYLPPHVPKQRDSWNCGPFMLELAR